MAEIRYNSIYYKEYIVIEKTLYESLMEKNKTKKQKTKQGLGYMDLKYNF